MSKPVAHPTQHQTASPSPRGQSLVEFALVLPMLLVLLLGIADFGRVFAAGITVEAAARNAAEIVAQEYLRSFPDDDLIGPAAPPATDEFYASLHRLAAQTACRETRGLSGVAYTPDNPGTVGTNEEACGPMPIIRTCIHDAGDTRCGEVGFGHSIPSDCADVSASMSSAMSGGGEQSRYVEVRICYEFTTIINLEDVQLPMNTGISVGEIWLQKDRVFGVGFYPPPPAPSAPPPPPPPAPTGLPPTPTPTATPTPIASPSTSATATASPTGTPGPTPTVTPTAAPTAVATPAPTASPTPVPTPTPAASLEAAP